MSLHDLIGWAMTHPWWAMAIGIVPACAIMYGLSWLLGTLTYRVDSLGIWLNALVFLLVIAWGGVWLGATYALFSYRPSPLDNPIDGIAQPTLISIALIAFTLIVGGKKGVEHEGFG